MVKPKLYDVLLTANSQAEQDEKNFTVLFFEMFEMTQHFVIMLLYDLFRHLNMTEIWGQIEEGR